MQLDDLHQWFKITTEYDDTEDEPSSDEDDAGDTEDGQAAVIHIHIHTALHTRHPIAWL